MTFFFFFFLFFSGRVLLEMKLVLGKALEGRLGMRSDSSRLVRLGESGRSLSESEESDTASSASSCAIRSSRVADRGRFEPATIDD